mgnify:CR=1 FL=1
MNTTYCCSCANVLFAELRLVVSEFNSIPTCAWLTRYFFAFFDLCTQYPPLRTSLQYFQEIKQVMLVYFIMVVFHMIYPMKLIYKVIGK